MENTQLPNFTETDYLAMQYDASRFVELSIDKIKEILINTPEHAEAIWNDFERVYHPTRSLDTAVCDIWYSAIAYYFVGRDWPTYGDRDDTFFDDLMVAFEKHGLRHKGKRQ
jgi:hypothetical protein